MSTVARLIPAHAGSTGALVTGGAHAGAHPRSRGEHVGLVHRGFNNAGSSPLTRGALAGKAKLAHTHGLIPAHAGSTMTRAGCSAPSGAHPRSRGEHFSLAVVISADLGSSPLTRGAHWPPAHPVRAARLIPAHAGSTRSKRTCRCRHRAHPRSRGEHATTVVAPISFWGSSPLTRGAPHV